MVISPLMLILIVVILVLLLGGSGYGYYNGGGFANPLALLGGLLIVGLVVWFVLGGGVWFSPPTKQIEIEIEERQPAREPGKLKIEREREQPRKEPERKERSQRQQREPEQPAIERLIKKDSVEVKL